MVDVYRLADVRLSLGSGNRVIKRRDMQAIEDASAIVAAAHDRAGEILAEAEVQREEERRRGLAEGTAAAEREAFERLLREQAQLDASLERSRVELTDLVLACTRAIIQDVNPVDAAMSLTRSALGRMRRERRCQLFVPNELLEPVQARIAEVLADFPEVELIDVVGDAALSPPTVVLASGLGRVKCSLDETVDALADILRGALIPVRPAAQEAVPRFGGAT
jgi:type III secretion protein L